MCVNSVPGVPAGSERACVSARWFTAVSTAAVARALPTLLTASTDIPLSVGLDESLQTFCSQPADITWPRPGRDDEARPGVPASWMAATGWEPRCDEKTDRRWLFSTCNDSIGTSARTCVIIIIITCRVSHYDGMQAMCSGYLTRVKCGFQPYARNARNTTRANCINFYASVTHAMQRNVRKENVCVKRYATQATQGPNFRQRKR